MNKTEKIIVIIGVSLSVIIGIFIVSKWALPEHYYPLGYGGWGEGAPDGIYLQKEWGWVNSVSFPAKGGWVNNATEWTFAICDHDYLGALHGTWKVAQGVSVPIWEKGVFPIDAQLYVTIKNQTIVACRVKSSLAYGD